jgi:hypothetical protein
MITNSKLQVIPATSDNANLFLSLQPNSVGLTNTILSATALTYNPFSRTLSLNGIRWPASDGTAGQVLRTDGAGNLTFGNAGLANFTDALSTTAPNATVPAASLTATNAGYVNIDAVLAPKGTGAILAQVPDGTIANGNKRGAGSVDFQMSRQTSAQVVNSAYSFIGSGQNNSLLNGQSHAIVTGTSNTINSQNSGWRNQFIGGGSTNSITYGQASTIVGGSSNSLGNGGGGFVGQSYTAGNQFIGGGTSNISNAQDGVIVGGNANWNSGPVAAIVGGQSGRQTSVWGALAGGFTNQVGATQFYITFFSQSGKNNIALSADDARIKPGLVVWNSDNNGQPVYDGETVSTYSPAGTAFATTSGSGNGSTYTLLHAGPAYAIDTWVRIAGVTLTSGTINGTYIVTASSSGSVSFASTATGTISINGTVRQSTTITASAAPVLSWNDPVGTARTTLFYPGVFIGGGANNQATGMYSVVVGGGDKVLATNRNTASGDWSFTGGGQKNTNSGPYATLVGGLNNQVSGASYAAIGGGQDNYVGYNWGTVAGGKSHSVDMAYGAIMGGAYGSTRGIMGFHAFPACNSPIAATAGTSQGGLLILACITGSATPTVLRSDAQTASATNQIALPSNSAYYVKGSVIATVTAGGNTKAWTFEVVIKKALTNATTSIVGTAIINITAADAGAATWTIGLTADTTNGALAITVTGQVANTIRWVCKAETTEVTF